MAKLKMGKYKWMSFKFVRDEGGKSYRLIDNNEKVILPCLRGKPLRMSLEAALDAFSKRTVLRDGYAFS